MEAVEDPRIGEDICRARHFDVSGREWICVKKPHAEVYIRHRGDRRHRPGQPIFSNHPSVDAHYFVNRYPNRTKE